MKTKTEMTQYKYAQECEVYPSTIYHRVATGSLILNKNGNVPEGTTIVKQMKLGREFGYVCKKKTA